MSAPRSRLSSETAAKAATVAVASRTRSTAERRAALGRAPGREHERRSPRPPSGDRRDARARRGGTGGRRRCRPRCRPGPARRRSAGRSRRSLRRSSRRSGHARGAGRPPPTATATIRPSNTSRRGLTRPTTRSSSRGAGPRDRTIETTVAVTTVTAMATTAAVAAIVGDSSAAGTSATAIAAATSAAGTAMSRPSTTRRSEHLAARGAPAARERHRRLPAASGEHGDQRQRRDAHQRGSQGHHGDDPLGGGPARLVSSRIGRHARAQGGVRGRRDVRRRVRDEEPVEVGDEAAERTLVDPLGVEELAPRVAEALRGRARVARQPGVRGVVDQQGRVEQLHLERQRADDRVDQLRIAEPVVLVGIERLVDPGDRRERVEVLVPCARSAGRPGRRSAARSRPARSRTAAAVSVEIAVS